MWIMESILIFLVVTLMMSSPALGISQSMSCSTVNGRTICEKQTSEGNSAAAFGGAAIGGGKTYQDAYAGAGNPGQWDYGRQTVYGTYPGAGGARQSGDGGIPMGGGGYPGRSPPGGVSSSVFSSSSSSFGNFPGQQDGLGFGTEVGGNGVAVGGAVGVGYPAQAFAGGFSAGGGFPMSGGGFAFGDNGGVGYLAQGGAGGFATGGFFPFGGGNPAQPPAGNPDEQRNQGQNQGFDPFMFVRPFFGGGGPLGGFPFGRR